MSETRCTCMGGCFLRVWSGSDEVSNHWHLPVPSAQTPLQPVLFRHSMFTMYMRAINGGPQLYDPYNFMYD